MIHAYDKLYLEKSRTALARMLDFAVNGMNYSITSFWDLFLVSGIAECFESGDASTVVGHSGIEIAYRVLEESGCGFEYVKPEFIPDRSREYWTGWALAYYQWQTAFSFFQITKNIPILSVMALYSPYHEMDIMQFCDKMNEIYRESKTDTNLKSQRVIMRMTQKELAESSGVPLRTIQQYEQGRKNINKAQTEYLKALSKTLCCDISRLLE